MIRLIDGIQDPEKQATGDAILAKIFFGQTEFGLPVPLYREYQDAVSSSITSLGSAVFSRYDDCRAVLRDPNFGKDDDGSVGPAGTRNPDVVAYRAEMAERRQGRATSMLGLNPPDHTRQRSLVSRAFTPRTVERLRPRITELVDELLDGMEAAARRGPIDLMQSLAMPLPVAVISEMLGVPSEDWPSIRDQVTDVVAVLETSATVADLQRAEKSDALLHRYFLDLLERRRANPTDDVLSGLIAASDGSDTLTEPEILAVVMLLFAAGAETTTNLVGNGMNLLLDNPIQMDKLWSNQDLIPAAIEEMLRHDSPVQLDGRMCLAPTTVAGMSFEKGDRVATLLGAANHDPDHFADPDEFLIDRFHGDDQPSAVMSFASGIHYCLGANLAKVEGQEVFAGLIRRFSSITAAGPRPFRNRLTLRGLVSCPIDVLARPNQD